MSETSDTPAEEVPAEEVAATPAEDYTPEADAEDEAEDAPATTGAWDGTPPGMKGDDDANDDPANPDEG